jgi:hypothetical protein
MARRTGTRRTRRTSSIALAIVASAAALLVAPTAQAGPLVQSADGCTPGTLEQPFQPWLDYMDYVLLGNGTFEKGASGWSLDGASVGSGNEPYYVHGAGETKSLSIAAGGRATSPTMCVGLEEPTLRFFMKSSTRSLLSDLKVEVLFEDATGAVRSLPIGSAPALTSGSWTPHLPMVVTANLLALVDDKTPVRFRFTAQGSANWQIDDVYVDPRYR